MSGYERKARKKKTVKKNYNEPQETLKDVAKYKCLSLPDRELEEDEAIEHGIRTAVCPKDGETPVKTYYPYYNKDGDIIGYKTRDWTIPKEQEGHFGTVGAVKVSCQLFGQHLIKKGGKKLIIVEGEEEVPAVKYAMKESIKGTRWEGKIEPNVVSIGLGTANAAEHIAHNLDFIQSFDEIVLGFDSDCATAKEKKKGVLKGKEATEEVAALLLSENIYTFEHPDGCKDSREAVSMGLAKELGNIIAFNLEKYSPEKIVSGDDVSIDDLIEPLKEGHYIERYPKLMDKIHGFRQGNELITYTAFSGVGKSTLAREIDWELITNTKDRIVGHIFLEEPLIKTQQSLIALELGIKLPEFRKDPLAVATREAIEEAKKRVLSNGRTYFLNHFGSLAVDKLMQQVKYLYFICGCTDIIIDHISMVVAGLATNNERKDIDMLYEELAAFITVNNVTIHAVCHLKRVESNEPKTKQGEEPQAFWRKVKKEYLRGSAGIEQMSSTIIALEDEILPNGERGRVRTVVLKNREWSYLGVCDTMIMKDDGRLHVVPDYDGWTIDQVDL